MELVSKEPGVARFSHSARVGRRFGLWGGDHVFLLFYHAFVIAVKLPLRRCVDCRAGAGVAPPAV